MGKIIKEFLAGLVSRHSNTFWVFCLGTYPIQFLYFLHLPIVWANVALTILVRVSASVLSAAVSGFVAAFIADLYKHKCKPKVDRFLKPKIKRNGKQNDNERAA